MINKVYYDESDPTVVINFNKFLPSFPTEHFFEVEGDLPSEKLEYYYITWDGETPTLNYKTKAERDAIDAAEEAARLADEAEAQAASDRMHEYVEAKKLEVLHTVTIQDVKDYIDAQIDPATMSNAEVVNGIKKVLKKLAVYTLMMHS
jgi:hypothetical protein